MRNLLIFAGQWTTMMSSKDIWSDINWNLNQFRLTSILQLLTGIKNITKQLTNFNYIFKDLNALKCFKLKTANHTWLKYLHGMNMKLASKHYSKLEWFTTNVSLNYPKLAPIRRVLYEKKSEIFHRQGVQFGTFQKMFILRSTYTRVRFIHTNLG